MIRLGDKKINKIGNTNRLYYNGSMVYQCYISKPIVPYENWTVIGDINGEYWVEDVPMYQDYDNPYIYKSEQKCLDLSLSMPGYNKTSPE